MEDDDDGNCLWLKKEEICFKVDDEEFGEGFDDYVEDGGLFFGKWVECERKK